MIVAGIDYSISSPGVCVLDTECEIEYNSLSLHFNMNNPSARFIKTWDLFDSNIHPSEQLPYSHEMERYGNLADWAMTIVADNKADVVVIEDYAMGAKGRVFNIAECTGILKSRLYCSGIEFMTVAPTRNKKLFTGKGNAGKEQMIAEFNSRFGVDISVKCMLNSNFYGSPVSDIVDATALALTVVN